MAAENEIASEMDKYLRAKGFTCGRSYTNIGNVAKGLEGKFSDETTTTLTAKIRSIAKNRSAEFKVRNDEISASRAGERDCGT